jgi:hypothetical protein
MKSLLEEPAQREIHARIEKLHAEQMPGWGKMRVAQMLRHCQFPLQTAMGTKPMRSPNPLMKLIFKSFKKSMYDDKLWKQGLPTPRSFRVEDDRDFNYEKDQLLRLVDDFHALKVKEDWPDHPAFGSFSKEQWGKMQYKHLDHHLRQFGV